MNTDPRLTNLPDIAARQLGGLNADARLLASIRASANQSKKKTFSFQFKPALACAAAALCLVVGLVAVLRQPGDGANVGERAATVLDSKSAGDNASSFGMPDSGELLGGSIAISGGADAPARATLFAAETDSGFPLLMVDGKTYRLLSEPHGLDASLIGAEIGVVSEFTLEPALSSGRGITSNAIPAGASVCEVDGLSGALLCADLGGETRVFQRVSFAGTATVGGESLADTLAPAAQVVSIELSGVGTVTDAQTAQRLMEVLYQNASFAGASANAGAGSSLRLRLQNGLCLQLLVSDDALSACGTWSCPEFFEAFAVAVSGS